MMSTSKKIQEGDIKVPSPPADGISSLSLNGDTQNRSNILVATAWDNTVSCYELVYDANNMVTRVNPQSQVRQDAPVLCSDFASDKVTVFTGGADNCVKMWNVTQGTTQQTVGQHSEPVKCVKFSADKSLVVSGSWDKTVKVWDCRQPTPTGTLTFDERVYAMDTRGTALVVATADKMVHVFDMTAGNKISTFKSTLTYQTRCLAIFHDNKGFAEGCIEGRVALEYFDELHTKSLDKSQKPAGLKSFAFKCHRQNDKDIFAVNAVHFHPHNTFLSAGSDGCLCIWDKEARHRISYFDAFNRQGTISDARFSPMGNLLAYAVSYDWSRGVEGNDPKLGHNIYLHNLQPAEVAPKRK